MQRSLEFTKRSSEEDIKKVGLVLDFDEISKRGAMTVDEAKVAKWYGIYSMRQPGNHMGRVVIPGGILLSSQARGLAKVAEDYAQGRLAVTTRQDVQMHWLKAVRLADFLRDVHATGLSTFHGCGDVNRNVVACPWAHNCRYARFDVSGDVWRVYRAFVDDRAFDNLPRKFKTSFSACGAGCGQPRMNDIGLVAVMARVHGELRPGYRVYIGGGHGWYPAVAEQLFSFIPRKVVVDVCKAIANLFRDHGDRFDRSRARLKFVVERMGVEECRRIVLTNLEQKGVDTRALLTSEVDDEGPPWPKRPLAVEDPVDRFGRAIVRARIDRGEIRFHQMERLAELTEIYGDKRLRLNNRQNVEIHGVLPENVAAFKEAIEDMGFSANGAHGLQDVVPCVGTSYCPLAVTRTHDLFASLRGVVDSEEFRPIRPGVLIDITGCPNSCSPYRMVDLGFRGARLRQQLGSVEGYEVSIGGEDGQIGQVLGTYMLEDCPEVARRILRVFAARRQEGESLAEHVCREGIGPYLEALVHVAQGQERAPAISEVSGRDGRFSGTLDKKTYARDVPCQAACPAGTRVPHYIEAIAKGDLDLAYSINQEDNVFPGVLGRVCSRPCEPACRHNWTGTHGPVAICHLKRYAADNRETTAPKVLPRYFDSSGKRVAVVGSGPAGLSASRELWRLGHHVVLFERERVLGGMMRLSIPHFRLPRHVLDAEIAAIVDAGIEVRTGETIDPDGVERLLGEFDAVVLAAGAIEPAPFTLEGLPERAAIPGVVFMRSFNLGEAPRPEPPVIIIGGGYTAIDCARAARRLLGTGGGPVKLMYRRTESQMTASRAEIQELAAEEIELDTLVSPVQARCDASGRLTSLTFRRNRLLSATTDGQKPPIEPLPGTEFEEPCRTLIAAVGQRRTLRLLPEGVAHTGHRTSLAGLFVAGDFSYGSRDVIHAVAHGKAVAEEVDEYLTGKRRLSKAIEIRVHETGWTGRVRDHDLIPPPPMPVVGPDRRSPHGEVELGFGHHDAKMNALRCYLCHYRYEVDQDACIHCDWCLKVMPRECIVKATRVFTDDGSVTDYVETDLPREATYIFIDANNCIGCGECLRICPTMAIWCRRMESTTCP